MTIRGLLLFALALWAGGLAAQEAPPSELTLEGVFRDKAFDAATFSGRWLPERAAYVTTEPSETVEGGKDLVLHDPATGETETLAAAEALIPAGASSPLAIDDFAISEDLGRVLIYTNSQRVWRQKTRGDYWVLDRSARQLRRLGGDAPPSSLMFAKLSPDGSQAAYVVDGNIFVESVTEGEPRQLTTKTAKTVINGTFDWVYEEELGLRDGFRWSPDGASIAYWHLDTAGVGRFPLVNNTDSLYPEVTWIPYPKVGERNSSCRVGVVEVASGETRWMNVPGDPRDRYIARMEWMRDGEELLVQALDRRQQEKRFWAANAKTGEVEAVTVDRDEAWVDTDDETFELDGERFTFASDRDGWRRIYVVSREGGEATAVTPGGFDAIELLEPVDDEWAYFIAAPGEAMRRYLYRTRWDGSKVERVTPGGRDGWHAYSLSADGRWAIHTFSTFDRPPTVELVSLPDHKSVRMLEGNVELVEKLAAVEPPETRFFQVDLGDGVELDAWEIRPPNMEAGKKYPVLVHVYGEPAGQTVADRWGGSRGLWHRMLAQRGYVVVSFDNRGTAAPRGRAFRKAAYQKIGVLSPEEQAAALGKLLDARPDLDRERVGVWGWSGGGSSTLQALFKHPELYHVGVSVAPVPAQRYYDTIYQERYMGLPSDNAEGFLKGSPINFAAGLEGDLLLIHGTGDDNVHYQGSELLINELIRLNKEFRFMAYPNRTHAISERENTTLHLHTLMTEFLAEKLPAGPR